MNRKSITKSIIVLGFLSIFLLPVGGCLETAALIGGGAAGGITWERLITQAQEDVQENIELLESQNVELEKKLETTTDEAEREKIRAEIKANLKVLDELGLAKLSLEEANKGLGVDWKNPEAAVIFVLGALTTYMQWRKKQQTTKALTEVVEGGELFKKAAAPEAVEVFKKSQTEAQKSNETKELVAVLKA